MFNFCEEFSCKSADKEEVLALAMSKVLDTFTRPASPLYALMCDKHRTTPIDEGLIADSDGVEMSRAGVVHQRCQERIC